MANDKITFYYEWLPLDKKEFELLAMLADQGEFHGNLSDICRYFGREPQNNARTRITNSIEQLSQNGYITVTKDGRTYTLTLIPQETELLVFRKLYENIKNKKNFSRSVAWQQVLKVYIFAIQRSHDVAKGKCSEYVFNRKIAAAINASEGIISDAHHVLANDLHAILHTIIRKQDKETGIIYCLGQENLTTAWYDSPSQK